jgi:hypothetical protein
MSLIIVFQAFETTLEYSLYFPLCLLLLVIASVYRWKAHLTVELDFILNLRLGLQCGDSVEVLIA